jgi:hypothetical protein
VVVHPVYFQPVSAVNSLLAGKIQGIYQDSRLIPAGIERVVSTNQRLAAKFRGQRNREKLERQ